MSEPSLLLSSTRRGTGHLQLPERCPVLLCPERRALCCSVHSTAPRAVLLLGWPDLQPPGSGSEAHPCPQTPGKPLFPFSQELGKTPFLMLGRCWAVWGDLWEHCTKHLAYQAYFIGPMTYARSHTSSGGLVGGVGPVPSAHGGLAEQLLSGRGSGCERPHGQFLPN